MTEKRCSQCKNMKPLTDFSQKMVRGKLQYYAACKPCRVVATRRSYEKNIEDRKAYQKRLNENLTTQKRIYVNAYLESHPCVDCGETDWVVLEFDHVRGVKKWNIGSMMNRTSSLDALIEEIAKCDVVCANDHRRRTYTRQGSWRTFEKENIA